MAQYIDKSALMAEIEKRKEAFETSDGRRFHSLSDQILWNAFNSIQDIINALEVKEVGSDYIKDELDKAIKIYKPGGDFGWGTLYNIAKHFFELGVNASNSLTWKDIDLILDITDQIANDDSMEEKLNNMSQEEYCTEVLKRFKAQKV